MKTAKEWVNELVFGEAATTLVRKLEETVEMIQHDAQDSLRAQLAVAEAKCKEACGECVPSGGYDYFDEVCGLLRVTRCQRDQALEELARLRAARGEK